MIARRPAATRNAGRPSRAPVLLSAFIFPGAGQLVQRRWGSAAVYAGAFLAACIVFVVYIARILVSYYGLAFGNGGTPPDVPLTEACLALLAAGAVYGASVFDAYRAYRTAGRRWAEQRLAERREELTGDHDNATGTAQTPAP
jgi:hypothetical protein